MEKVIGVKGFDKDLKCRGFEFKIGKTYEEEYKPKLCKRGFHFCSSIEDVFQYYKKNGQNRFCLIEAIGDIDFGTDKHATNKIRIVRELTKEEVDCKLTNEIIALKLKELCDDGFIIGGSFALKAHGYTINRSISDIDIITTEPDRSKIMDKFKNKPSIKEFSSRDSICAFKGISGERYDVLFNQDAHSVKRYFCGVELNVQDDVEIWQVKLKYALNGVKKHMDDILKNGISFKMLPRESVDMSLPF